MSMWPVNIEEFRKIKLSCAGSTPSFFKTLQDFDVENFVQLDLEDACFNTPGPLSDNVQLLRYEKYYGRILDPLESQVWLSLLHNNI
ncbi:hypothetical protein MXB_1211, partial [Myxobolus squamalis]